MLRVLNRAFDHPMKSEEQAVTLLAGGIMQHGYQCGMIWGATLAAGAQAYKLLGPGPRAETRAVVAARRLVESFRALNTDINCLEITGLDKSSSTMKMVTYFILKGGSVGCYRKVTRYASEAFNEINSALSESEPNEPSSPVSCAALLAGKMGQSDLHTVMAAGLAGGIGLCGGACGALGAAVWITALNSLRRGTEKVDYKDPAVAGLVDKFLKCTDYEFECSTIVGRKFENVEDHADYIRGGGCSEILESLAEETSRD